MDLTVLIAAIEKLLNAYFALMPRPKPSLKELKATRIIAHRGAHYSGLGIQENTRKAFAEALKLGCWGIEFDIHETADQILVVNHDATLERIWGRQGTIANLNFKQLNQIEPKLPSLKEVIREFGKSLHLFIELKTPLQDESVLVEALNGLTPGEDYHLLSLEASYFTSLTQFPKSCLLLVPLHNNVKHFCNISLKEQYGGVMGSYLLLTRFLINKLKNQNQKVGVGFVDSKYSLYREVNKGVQWIFTNNAREMMEYVKGR